MYSLVAHILSILKSSLSFLCLSGLENCQKPKHKYGNCLDSQSDPLVFYSKPEMADNN